MPNRADFPRHSVARKLFTEGYDFSFFQAVRLLEQLDASRAKIGRDGPPRDETVRFRAYQSLGFPPSVIHDVEADDAQAPPTMTVTFFGLTGTNGILPRHYTEMLLRLQREDKGAEKHALRDWFDLFNHRLIALFYRAWEKYHFFLAYERRESTLDEPDPFTRCLYSLAGLGTNGLRNRLRISQADPRTGAEKVLGKVEDMGLLFHAGILAHRPRSAAGLEAILRDYFQLPAEVRQFQGQWLQLDVPNQSSFAGTMGNNQLGIDSVAGERVWDLQSKIRIRIGPLNRDDFTSLLPDRAPSTRRKAFFLLLHLVRLYIGPTLAFDVQLVVHAREVPECALQDGPGVGPHLGWNTWLVSQPGASAAEEAVFEGEEAVWV